MKALKPLLLLAVIAIIMLFAACDMPDDCKHNWKSATCTEQKECTLCGALEGEPKGHDFHMVSYVSPDCTTDGINKYQCKNCDHSYEEAVAALGHTKKTSAGYSATCLETGLTDEITCSVCEEVLSKGEIIPALGHNIVTDKGFAATCSKTGLTDGTHCSVCNEVIVVQEEIPKLAHTEVILERKEPTCTETGLISGKKCATCNATLISQQVIPAQHTRKVVDAVSATCSEPGLTWGEYCTVCNMVFTEQEVVPATGDHSYSYTTESATCLEAGIKIYTCNNCDDSYTEEYIEALGHDIDSYGVCTRCEENFCVDATELLGEPTSFSWRETTENYVNEVIITYMSAMNLTGNTINYITVVLKYYNAVDDAIYSASFKKTGPIQAGAEIDMTMKVGDTSYSYWKNVSNAGEKVADVRIFSVIIEYSDGTKAYGAYSY